MASFRDELATAAQKEHYIRTYLGITAPKKSREYRTAARRLQFLAAGKTKAPRDERYQRIVNVAEFNADVKATMPDDDAENYDYNIGQDFGHASSQFDADYAQEGDEIYAEMIFQFSRERINRKGAIEVSWKEAGMSIEAAWIQAYWGDGLMDETVAWVSTITCYRI